MSRPSMIRPRPIQASNRRARDTRRGRPGPPRHRPPCPTPSGEAEGLQFAVGEHRVVGDNCGSGSGELIAKTEGTGERRLLHSAAVGDTEDADRPTGETVEQRSDPTGDIGRHREVRVAGCSHHRRRGITGEVHHRIHRDAVTTDGDAGPMDGLNGSLQASMIARTSTPIVSACRAN